MAATPTAVELTPEAVDVVPSAIAFAAEAASLPDEAWAAQVQGLAGPPMPARRVLDWRLREVEIHHVDLGTGYLPAAWPAEFAADNLPEVAGSFAGREDAPPCLLQPDGSGPLQIGPEQPAPPRLLVHGPPASLLAWLTGRDDGSGLRMRARHSGGGRQASASGEFPQAVKGQVREGSAD